jgi:excisionase family DNA binding protein
VKNEIDSMTFSIAEAAKALGVHPDTVRRRVRDGSIPAVQLRDRGRILILKQYLLDQITDALGERDKDTERLRAEDALNCVSGYARITVTEPTFDAEGHVTGSTTRSIDVPGYDPRHPLNVERSKKRNAAIEAEARELGYAAPVIV